jgi:hypothetical protein
LITSAKTFGFQNASVEEIAADLIKTFTVSREATNKPPYKVKVMTGDGQTLVGYGTYTGNVKVYFLAMPDGNIQSLANAELPIQEADVPPGAEVVEVADNPKIVMDDGKVVYGCQVWWEKV